MSADNISRNTRGIWEEQKAKLKAKFPVLTDADLYYENGKRHDMLYNLQSKIGKSKKELEEIITAL
jgi:uncharacterized protein YjbJ (UPF0337 family)